MWLIDPVQLEHTPEGFMQFIVAITIEMHIEYQKDIINIFNKYIHNNELLRFLDKI
jgi:hypothetical protein